MPAVRRPHRVPQIRLSQVAEALRASEARYKSLFEHDLTGDFIARPDGTILLCNRAFAEIFGFARPSSPSPKSARGTNLARLLPQPGAWPAVLRLLKRRKVVSRRAANWVRLDGTTVHIVQTLVGAFNELGELAEVQGYLFDDTQRFQAARELARSRNKLETLIQERTNELEDAHLRLRLADRLASIGTLAAGLGHDMNNVLLPVRARLNGLRQVKRLSEVRVYTKAIGESVAYLQSLADGLHYLAQDPDNVRPDNTATDLRHWWNQAGAIIAKAVPRYVKVTASFAPNLPLISVAPHRLTQAVLNLVVNAGEAIPPLAADPSRKRRQARVRVWAEVAEGGERDGGGWVRLGVTDNGAGMTPEVRRRAFELFFTTKPRGHGTGLGLPLVHKVASGAGGSVEIDTALGKGTTVTMVLPAAVPAMPIARSIQATVTIADGRIAALVRHVLEAVGGSGCAVTVNSSPVVPSDTDVWLVEPSAAALPLARRWIAAKGAQPRGRKGGRAGGRKTRGERGRRCLILLGRPLPADAARWATLHPDTIIHEVSDFEALRAAVARTLTSR